jgi:hypothetical protein
MKQYATKLTNRYDASVARRVTDDSIRIEDNELMNMDVPTEFTLDERRFFRDIMFDIDQAAGFGSYQTEIYPYEKYSIYTSNILTFLSKLGYHTDTSTNIVSWKEE